MSPCNEVRNQVGGEHPTERAIALRENYSSRMRDFGNGPVARIGTARTAAVISDHRPHATPGGPLPKLRRGYESTPRCVELPIPIGRDCVMLRYGIRMVSGIFS
jgi:hypothetical protein